MEAGAQAAAAGKPPPRGLLARLAGAKDTLKQRPRQAAAAAEVAAPVADAAAAGEQLQVRVDARLLRACSWGL